MEKLTMKKLILTVVLTSISLAAYAATITTLLSSVTSTGAGRGVNYTLFSPGVPLPIRTFQATLNGASAISATVEVDGSNDNVNWVPVMTITLPNSTTSAMTDGGPTDQSWGWLRGNVIAISGVGGYVTLISVQ